MESIASLFGPLYLALKDRRPSTAVDIARCQRQQLRKILADAHGTAIHRQLKLSQVNERDLVRSFRETVPIACYADIQTMVEQVRRRERDVLFHGHAVAMAQTSGTTSDQQAGERYIPQNTALLDNGTLGGIASLSRLVQSAGPSLLGGKLLMLGGSTSLERNQWGVPEGDLSGIMARRIPRLLQGKYEPGPDIALESDWRQKLERIAARCANRDIRLVSGIASWLHVLFETICRTKGISRIDQCWNLRGMIHGGASISPNLAMLRDHLPDSIWMMEVYPASEGFLAVGSRPWRLGEGQPPELEVLSDHGLFLEFLPEGADPVDAVGVESLEKGQVYRVLVTNPAGLFRYELGDLVQGEGPGHLRVAGRVKTRLSVFGEHVEGMEMDAALAHANQVHDSRITQYHVAPIFPEAGQPAGRHEWWIEFLQPPSSPESYAAALDRHLCEHVLDYAAHRHDDLQLLPPVVHPVPPGTFHRALERQGKLGGQHKVPQASQDRQFATHLKESLA
jgi:GH3 auxin-responsive promoter